MTGLQPDGFSHSDIRASKVICTYARLFAAYHVLLRLQEPRHPPYALSYLLYPPLFLSPACADNRGVSVESCTLSFTLIAFLIFARCCTFTLRLHTSLHVTGKGANLFCCPICQRTFANFFAEVENNGFEPLTPCLQSRCSSQLS